MVAELVELREDPPPLAGATADPKDDNLVAPARDVSADYLISGDRHLTELTNPMPSVLTLRQLLDQLGKQP